jgi:hypothetical protein
MDSERPRKGPSSPRLGLVVRIPSIGCAENGPYSSHSPPQLSGEGLRAAILDESTKSPIEARISCSLKLVPRSRSQGIDRYRLGNARESQLRFRQERQVWESFPVFSPLNRDPPPEPSSPPAPATATQAVGAETSRSEPRMDPEMPAKLWRCGSRTRSDLRPAGRARNRSSDSTR